MNDAYDNTACRTSSSVVVIAGMTWKEAHARCPQGVIPACHNSTDTVTVSGPADSVADFVAELQKEGVFAKAVHSGGVAFHSYYMSQTAPALKERLQQVCFILFASQLLLADCLLFHVNYRVMHYFHIYQCFDTRLVV